MCKNDDENIIRKPVRILFVCYANICRSPMAEAVFLQLVKEAGLIGKIEASSAGISYGKFNEEPDPRTVKVLADHGIDCQHQTRRIVNSDLFEFDYVLAADTDVLRSIWGMGKGTAKVQLLMKYAPTSDYTEVPDPVRTNKFELVYDLVSLAAAGLLAFIQTKHQL